MRWISLGIGLLVAGACGGESSGGDGTGGTAGTAPDGSAGSTAGTAGSAGSGGVAGTSGTAGCGGSGASDCVHPCTGQLYGPTCENGVWGCEHENTPCDAGTDAPVDAADCPKGEVPTVEGCLTCNDASTKLDDAITKARETNAACSAATDCMMADASTPCAGSCPVAISKSGEQHFKDAIAKIAGDYCSDFVSECGYSTPKCANATLICSAGLCEAKYN